MMIKQYKKTIIILSCAIVMIGVGGYAAIMDSDNNHYKLDASTIGVCLTGPVENPQKYALTFNPPIQKSLFIPKKTLSEWNAFLYAAQSPNSFFVTGVYRYDTFDYYGEICGSYNACARGITHDAGYDEIPPSCSQWRYCTTPCGEVTCGGPIVCP